MTVREPASGRQRRSTGEQELDPVRHLGRRVRQQPERRTEPLRGALRREPRDRVDAGFTEDGHRGGVRRARRGVRGDGRAPPAGRRGARRRKRGPHIARGPPPPARGRVLVCRAPEERVAEPEAPRDVGGADQVETNQLRRLRPSSRRRTTLRQQRRGARARTDPPPAAAPSNTSRAWVGQEAQLLSQRCGHRRRRRQGSVRSRACAGVEPPPRSSDLASCSR